MSESGGLRAKLGGDPEQWQICLVFALFWGCYLLLSPSLADDLQQGWVNGGLKHWAQLFAVLCAAYCAIGAGLSFLKNKYLILCALFCLALAPRLWVVNSGFCRPTNDFMLYLNFGQSFCKGNFDWIAEKIAVYRISMPTLGGVAVFYGILCSIFSPTAAGVQLANAVMTSCTSVFIAAFLYDYDKRAAICGALLYALYPAGIVSAAILTNHHGAVFFFLAAILLFSKIHPAERVKKAAPWALACGLLLTASNFVHPSVIVVLISIFFCALIALCANWRLEKKLCCAANRCLAACFLLTALTFCCLMPLGIEALRGAGLIRSNRGTTILFKVVLGLNQESGGTYDDRDIRWLHAIPYEEQPQAAWKMIRERLEPPEQVLNLMLYKVQHAFFAPDGHFSWFCAWQADRCRLDLKLGADDGEHALAYMKLKAIMADCALLDALYLRLIYLLAILGALLLPKLRRPDAAYVFMYIPLGWAAVIMLTEEQSRYRCPSMPAFFVLAAVGLCECLRQARRLRGK